MVFFSEVFADDKLIIVSVLCVGSLSFSCSLPHSNSHTLSHHSLTCSHALSLSLLLQIVLWWQFWNCWLVHGKQVSGITAGPSLNMDACTQSQLCLHTPFIHHSLHQHPHTPTLWAVRGWLSCCNAPLQQAYVCCSSCSLCLLFEIFHMKYGQFLQVMNTGQKIWAHFEYHL